MRQCPQCKAAHKTLPVEGWLVYGRATLAQDENGDESMVAIVPTLTFNSAGYQRYARGTCPNCSYKGELTSFTVLHTCVLTGKAASEQVILFGDPVWVSAEVLGTVERLQSVDLSMNWNALREQLNV